MYVSASSGVQVFSPAGDLLGEIRLPGAVNLTLGGRDNGTLFITTDTAIWAASLQTSGAPRHAGIRLSRAMCDMTSRNSPTFDPVVRHVP